MAEQVSGNKRTNHIDAHVMVASPVEGRFRKRGSDACSPKRLGNLAVKKFKNVAGDGVFQISDLAITLEFKAAVRNYYWSRLFASEESHGN